MPNSSEHYTAKLADNKFQEKLGFLSSATLQPVLLELRRGIEKEGLRVTPQGHLSTTPHPIALGSALTNSWVTTDFSESLLEFITPAKKSAAAALKFLSQSHTFAANILDDEIIWGASMPCRLPLDNAIPLAQYGSSNIAQMKTVYRRGLGLRYGRAMQTVAGIHYNFSLPDSYWKHEINLTASASTKKPPPIQEYINTRYLDLIRNFRRHYWLLIYLFGSAPCADPSFVRNRLHTLQTLNSGDLYLPHATSLRMGDLGYQSAAQKSLFVCYNELSTYIKTLQQAMQTTYRPYEQYESLIDGEYQQLSASLLQIENEFYSPIRPKRNTHAGEKPLEALAERGIEYIEVRCLDINPFMPLGIDEETINFLDAFLLTCLIYDSPLCDEQEFTQISDNQARIVNNGRAPQLTVFYDKKEINMAEHAENILNNVGMVAKLLDSANHCSHYSESVSAQLKKINNPALTPSAKIIDLLQNECRPFVDLITERSYDAMKRHRSEPIHAPLYESLKKIALDSVAAQTEIEKNDVESFDNYLKRYFS